jgi:hypothetical protein
MRRTVPILIASLSGFVLVLAFFSPQTKSWSEAAVNWFNVLAAIAFILGAGSLLKVQLAKISARRPGWGYAAITLASFLVTLAVGLLKVGTVPSDRFPQHAWTGDYEAPQAAFGWLYLYVMSPLTATMFALLAFYVASAAFRAFRAKNLAAILLLSAAFLVLLGRTAAAGFRRHHADLRRHPGQPGHRDRHRPRRRRDLAPRAARPRAALSRKLGRRRELT